MYQSAFDAHWTGLAAHELRFELPLPFGFDLHWMYEPSAGVLRNAAGIRLDSATAARATATIGGTFRAHTEPFTDSSGAARIHLTILRVGSRPLAISTRAQVTAPESPEELLQALLGIHPVEWLRSVFGGIGSLRFRHIARKCRARAGHFELLIESWQQLGSRVDASLWKAAASEQALRRLALWARWIAGECADEHALEAKIQTALGNDPALFLSPAGRFLVSAGGDFADTKAAAARVDLITGRPELCSLLLALRRYAATELSYHQPGAWVLERLAESYGCPPNRNNLFGQAGPWLELRNRIYQQAAAALERELPAAIEAATSADSGAPTLVDATFDTSPAGLELLHGALAGDLAPLQHETNPHVELRRGLLTHQFNRFRYIQVQLPFVDRRAWQSNRIPGAAVVSVSHMSAPGPLLLGGGFASRSGEPANDNFLLTFTDTRTVSAGGDNYFWLKVLEIYGLPVPELPEVPASATLTLSLPGAHCAAWCVTPHSRDEQYLPTFARVSRAIQRALRSWLPVFYFGDLDCYRHSSVVLALLAYHCSAPHTGQRRNQYCYDPIDHAAIQRALSTSERRMPAVLENVQVVLQAAGNDKVAQRYDPGNLRHHLAAALQQRRNFSSLLAADAMFIEECIHLADCAREVRASAQHEPVKALKNFSRYSGEFSQAFQRRLRCIRLVRVDPSFQNMLLMEATAALLAPRELKPRIAAKLALQTPAGGRVWCNQPAREFL